MTPPRPISPLRGRHVVIINRESLEEKLLREARELARHDLAREQAKREYQRHLLEGREFHVRESKRTMAEKINRILADCGKKPYGLEKEMELLGTKKVSRYLTGKSKTPPGTAAQIAVALSTLCARKITEKDIEAD